MSKLCLRPILTILQQICMPKKQPRRYRRNYSLLGIAVHREGTGLGGKRLRDWAIFIDQCGVRDRRVFRDLFGSFFACR